MERGTPAGSETTQVRRCSRLGPVSSAERIVSGGAPKREVASGGQRGWASTSSSTVSTSGKA
jgi:hypothetical protein